MRNLVIILFLLINATTLFAQSSISDLYKQWAFEDINNGHFNSAVSNLIHIDDWSISDYLDPDSVVSFANYSKSMNFPLSILDSMYLYVSLEYEIIGGEYYINNEYNNAISVYTEQYSWNLSYLSEVHPKHIMLLNNLGLLYSNIGNYLVAEKYYLEAIDCQQEVGFDSLNYATLLHNIGVLYTDMGNYKDAEKYHIRALEIRKHILGVNSVD